MDISSPPGLRPDSQLYIYYCQGVLPPHCSLDYENFVGNWVEDDFSFLFFTAPAETEVKNILKSFPELSLLDDYTMSYAEWQGGVVEPVRCGRFILNPTWIKAHPGENEIAITVDAGVVFGNGTHPTTQACLEAIDIACKGAETKTMIDLGTGTGVLALAGAMLGCHRVLAVDYNFLATKTARKNVVLNGLESKIVVVNGQAEQQLKTPTDLLVANIHYDVMKDIVRDECFQSHKWFVLSGLLRSEADKILSFLQNQPVLILKKWCQDGIWHTFLGITEKDL